jgi:hypothetical protein
MANTQKVDVTKEEVQKAQNLWLSFTTMMKWGIIVVIATLVFMALFLL